MFEKKGSKQSAPQTRVPDRPEEPTLSGAMASSTTGKTAMIGTGVSITGDVSSNANLVIEGRIEGKTVLGSHGVEISQSGEISANVVAKVVKVAGKVQGDIAGAEKVMVTSTGQVLGNISAPRVQLEDGAVFRGSIDMDPVDTSAAEIALSGTQASGQAGRPQGVGSDAAKKDPGLALKSG